MFRFLDQIPLGRKLPLAIILFGIIGGSLTALGNFVAVRDLLRTHAIEAITHATAGQALRLEATGKMWVDEISRRADDPYIMRAVHDFIKNKRQSEQAQEEKRATAAREADTPYEPGVPQDFPAALPVVNPIPYARHHYHLREFARSIGLDDLLIVASSWEVLYSLQGGKEIGENLQDMADRGLASMIRRARKPGQAWLSAETHVIGEEQEDGLPRILVATPISGTQAAMSGNGTVAWLVGVLTAERITEAITPTLNQKSLDDDKTENSSFPQFHVLGQNLESRSHRLSGFGPDWRGALEPELISAAEDAALNGSAFYERSAHLWGSGDERAEDMFLSLHRTDFLGMKWIVVGMLPTAKVAHDLTKSSLHILSATLTLILILALATGRIAHSFVRPINKIIQRLETTSSSHLSETLLDLARRGDEVGRIAQRVLRAQENLIERERIEAKKHEELSRTHDKRHRQQVADDFNAALGRTVEAIAQPIQVMRQTSDKMISVVSGASDQIEEIAVSSRQAHLNVRGVASATAQLSSSTEDISQQVGDSSAIAADAARRADLNRLTVNKLTLSARRIGDIIGLIDEIAEQTNLLALNATIEAARAGEAGRGFSIVASEVKSLAEQTKKATEQIAGQISSIQSHTADVVLDIKEMSGVIDQMNEIASSIATAVQRQAVTTSEIVRNIHEANESTETAMKFVLQLRSGTEEMGESTKGVLSSTGAVAFQFHRIQNDMRQFLASLYESSPTPLTLPKLRLAA